ncbi:hypothetical protein Tco_0989947 [Tanacetum coccineum]|uniref:CCHC-type domain-containing protein n=1 Tax=Tanacetum coccineum TaxID=301880 RepID=A0ABQ5EVQ7_9ASTR
MASLDYRLNPLFTIKECSSCGSLYNKECCCSNMSSVGKFVHDSNKAPYSPPHPHTVSSNQRHCFHCKDVLRDGEFCQRCTCKSCGNDAHYGYNCPPQVLIISNLEPCNNQTVDELPQTLPSFDPTCYSGDGSSFIYDSTPNFVNDSPNVFNPPSQPTTYSCEFCWNDTHYGYDCPPQVLFIYNLEPCYNQDFNFPQNFQGFQQQYICCTHCGGSHETFQCQQVIFYEPCCENCGGPRATFQCQPMNYYEPNLCYESNYSGFDQFEPPQYFVIRQPPHEKTIGELLAEERAANFDKSPPQEMSIQDMEDLKQNYLDEMKSLINDLQIKDYHNERIDIQYRRESTESDEVINSSVEDLVPIPSESEDTSDNDSESDLPFCDNYVTFSNPLFDANDDFTSSDDESFPEEDKLLNNDPSSPLPPKELNFEELKVIKSNVSTDFEDDYYDSEGDIDVLREKLSKINLFIAKIEALKYNPTPSSDFVTKSPSTSPNSFLEETNISYNSLPDSETFCFNLEEKSSCNPTSYIDLSLPDYEAFFCDSEPDSGDFTMDSFVIKSPILVEDGDSFLEKFEQPRLETF